MPHLVEEPPSETVEYSRENIERNLVGVTKGNTWFTDDDAGLCRPITFISVGPSHS